MGELAAFLGIAILVIVTPGQDTALTIRNTMLGGRPAGVATAAGVAAGQACWTVAASIGLAALLVASEPVFVALKLAGAAYLVYLGLQALRHAIRPGTPHRRAGRRLAARCSPRIPPGPAEQPRQPEDGDLLHEPAAAVRKLLRSLLALGLLFCSLTLAWLSAYSFAVARAGDLLRRPRIRRSLDAFTGTCLVAFGIRLAAER